MEHRGPRQRLGRIDMTANQRFMTLFLLASWGFAARAEDQTLPRLKVSENQRFLVKEDGKPFFYLGDTAWELFHRLNREEADAT